MLKTNPIVKQSIILLMSLLQLLWLVALLVTNTTAHPEKAQYTIGYCLLVSILILSFPDRFFIWIPHLEDFLTRRGRQLLFILLFIFFLVGAYYAYVQRVWPWDEENSFLAAKIVAEDGILALFRGYLELPWLGVQHPPLMTIVYGYAMRLFGISLFNMRLVAVLMGVALAFITYKIGEEIYDRQTGLISMLSLMSFPLIVRQMSAAMTDVPVTLFFSLVIWLTLRLRKRPFYTPALLIAVIIGIGMLIKYTMVFIYPVLFALFIFLPSLRKHAKLLLIICSVPFAFLLVWAGYAYAFGILASQIETLIQYASLIMTNQLARQFALETFTTRLPSALGVFNIPLMGISAYYFLRDRREPELILMIWIALIWILLALTLPDHRYFMLSFPAIAILIGKGLVSFVKNGERAIILALLFNAGALYIFVDWSRLAHVFIP